MNTFNPEDPKWTAYLLGELPPEATKECEEELEAHPEAKAYLQELTGVKDQLGDLFGKETDLELDPEQKGVVTVAAANRKNPIPLKVWALPIAATIMIALALPLLQPEKPVWQEIHEHPLQNSVDGDVEVIDDLEEAEETDPMAEFDFVVEEEPAKGQTVEASAVSASETKSLTDLMSDISSPVVMEGLLVSGERKKMEKENNEAFGGAPVPASEPVSSVRRELSRRTRQSQATPLLSSRPQGQIVLQDAPNRPEIISPSQDEFDVLENNPFRRVSDHPLSTFSIDVDTASYSVVRKMLKEGRLPPKDAVRIEEMVNYFKYDYAAPTDGSPFAAHMQVAECPWAPEHHLVRVALKGRVIPAEERPALNLVYLLDVSGSMSGGNRLPLVKRAMKTLVSQLDERDRVAIVVYAGAAGLVLPSTSGENANAITEALDRLNAGGSTAGGAGIQLAYETARKQFVDGGVNRVILCTDGDFNVGLNQTGDLQTLIEEEAKSGVQLTVLGFGMGNYKDDTLETLSNKGNGNYAYIDDFQEARKVLVDDLLGNMITIAKDVKIQVEFNPAFVEAYRLVGYENRMLKKEDFNNDKVDAGEIGAGHTVTALYELVPPGKPVPGEAPAVDDLKYQKPAIAPEGNDQELLTLKLRHKKPDGDTSVKTEFPLAASALETADPDQDFRFASAVAAFGFWLREPEFRETTSLEDILELGISGKGMDAFGYRSEFLQLVRAAEALR